MRLLQVTASADRRGAEVFADQLAESLRRRGHVVDTVALCDRPGPLPFDPIGSGRFDPRVLARLGAAMRSHDVTVVHGGAGLAPVATVGALVRRPFVYRNIGDPAFWGAVRGAGLRVGLPLRRAARVVALYDTAARYMVATYHLRPGRVATASNAVDADRFPRRDALARRAARDALGVQDDRPLLGYIGALSAEKQPEWALQLVAAIDGAELVIAGDGPLRGDLEGTAARSAPGRVRFLGSVDTPREVLDALDVLVIPSRTEGIPGVLIEAAFVGTPVVATAVGGVGDVLGSIGGGIAVAASTAQDLLPAVQQVLGDAEGHIADRERVEAAHDMERVAAVWESVLSDVPVRSD
jgi:glycosyltransferase involved in cell wall biosynthesis